MQSLLGITTNEEMLRSPRVRFSVLEFKNAIQKSREIMRVNGNKANIYRHTNSLYIYIKI
jgi:hypothetical protein